ncbi:hypothetical protein JQ628_18735 [Bradyrhizobium lablabi]|uniref:DUF6925 family protein n=1 Tax=Bradyrhizobium lablabi TaxID=722472 RepID=UPI001BAD5112|nr:hypothetical protein [Bradyrhizobium lablabi]MBR1123568.1 hypothetical protein [Bradyrhizobium lablabi]
MTPAAATLALLRQAMADPDTQWSLGTFGAIAEFSRDEDEPARLSMTANVLSAVTGRGGIAIRPDAAIRPFASEGITKTGWSQRVALCLPQDACAMSRRSALTEIGPDRDALREEDRDGLLFDLGLDALQADFCVRIDNEETAAQLRAHAGRPVFEPGNPAMGIILHANPHRVFISRIGRIEVYQPIPPPSGKSPDGPHTHVLPKLLRSGRTHPATEPIPTGWIPCAHIYPPHPARNGLGEPHPFDPGRHVAFQQVMALCGDPEIVAIKQRALEAVAAGEPPPGTAVDRHRRTGIRIALRQMKAEGQTSSALSAWLAHLDQGIIDDNDDEALQHG